MIRTKKSAKKKAALAGHKAQARNNFLASGRKMNWFNVGASIFASNLGSEHFIGLSGSAAANGIAVAAFEMNALIILQLATWIFLPVLIVSKISTLPEYMSKRFGGKRIRTYLAILSILLYIFTKISVNLFSGGIFIQQAIGWNLYTSAMFILALTCIMTLTGGLKGAMVIDNLQAFVMTIGASLVATKALYTIGGWEGLKHKYSLAVPTKVPTNLTHCAQPNPRAFQMLRPYNDRDMPWLGFLLGQTSASIWYWAADQMMVQRFLSARSLAHVQGSSVFAGYLKVLPFVFMVIPGMISRCLYTDEVGCIDPIECQKYCQSSVSCSNTAYPRLVLELMPMGARGMMVAAMVAALMGDLCNVFNSASALFSCDIYPLFRKHSSSKEQETSGRVFVICLVMASIMWIPVIQEMQGGQLFIYIQAVSAIFAPPIAAVYMCAVLWKRTNEPGAFWSLMIGFALGIMRLVLSFMYKEPSCGQHIDERPWIIKHVHYMYYAAFLFWATVGCCVLISKLTKPPAPFRLIRTTYWTRFDTNIRKDDKNVFEMKYSGATTMGQHGSLNTIGGSTNMLLSNSSSNNNLLDSQSLSQSSQTRTSTTSANLLSTDDTLLNNSIKSTNSNQQQRLFTIEENPPPTQAATPTADLSSIIVDINKAASEEKKKNNKGVVIDEQEEEEEEAFDWNKSKKKFSSMKASSGNKKRAPLQHQTSLSASASAAVGAASEAGKFIANKLASEIVNLNVGGAKSMVMAAASHLTGGPGASGASGSSRIKLQQLKEDDDDDDDDDDDNDNAAVRLKKEADDDDDDYYDYDEEENDIQESTTMDEEEEEYNNYVEKQRQKKNKRSQSVLSAAINSYKQKQGGYKRTLDNDDDDEDDDEDDDDDGDDEKMNLNRSGSFKNKKSLSTMAKEQKQHELDKNNNLKSGAAHAASSVAAASATSKRRPPSKRRIRRGGAGRASKGTRPNGMRPEADDNDDLESGKTYKCLDNTVALLVKTRFEETILRVALIAIVFVAIGLFILLSMPPQAPPSDVVDILIKN